MKGLGHAVEFRFNPPPGWPPSPEGFVPPPGWQPDPRWPAPPPGWQFWLPAGGAPVSSGAPAEAAWPLPAEAAWPLTAQVPHPGQVATAGENAQPGGPGAPGHHAAAPQRPAKSTIWFLVTAGVLCVVMVVVSLVYLQSQPSAPGPRPTSRILVPAPAAAGGLIRDYTAERTTYRTALANIQSRFSRAATGVASSFAVAVYDEPGHADPITKGPVRVVFLGINAASGSSDPSGDVKSFLGGLAASVAGRAVVGNPTSVPAGPGGGSAECIVTTTLTAQGDICAWATDWTMGTLIIPGRDTSMSQLAAIMRRVRPDVEHG
jgi:hypothetical protein